MVKVKTIFCILCVCNPLFTSQHLLSWDTRLWPLLGGTSQTRWFPTPEPIENFYSGVVSLRNLRLVIFLGKLNHLDLWGADIGNAYLEHSLMKSST